MVAAKVRGLEQQCEQTSQQLTEARQASAELHTALETKDSEHRLAMERQAESSDAIVAQMDSAMKGAQEEARRLKAQLRDGQLAQVDLICSNLICAFCFHLRWELTKPGPVGASYLFVFMISGSVICSLTSHRTRLRLKSERLSPRPRQATARLARKRVLLGVGLFLLFCIFFLFWLGC